MTLSVHKFGGVALADAAAIRRAAGIVARLRAERPADGLAVVASAMGGVTDALLTIADLALARGHDAAAATIERLRDRHHAAARDLVADDELRRSLARTIDAEVDELVEISRELAAFASVGVSPATTDRVVARGERLSAHLLVAALRDAGMKAEYVDASLVVHTNGRHGDAAPDFARTASAVGEHLAPRLARGVLPVVPGFVGRGPDGAIVTLGRGGSDLTATLLARALGAATVTLWKDVPGVLTADPRVVPDARLIPYVHVREAAELAYYGAKVLHPRALLGVGDAPRILIRPLADPTAPGTEISRRRDPDAERRHPVRAITAIGAQAIVTISGDGMVGVPGIAARAFGALERVGISVALISQASSEHSICLAVPDAVASAAEAALREAFAQQLMRGEVEAIDVRRDAAILAVVGLGMAGTIGVAARLFEAIAGTGTSVIAIAQGASELNISVVVDAPSAPVVQRAVHDAFHLGKIGGGAATPADGVDVVILGYGRVGRELASQIAAVAERGSRALRVVGVVDSSGYVVDARGLTRPQLAALAARKEAGGALADEPRAVRGGPVEALAAATGHALARPILVDVTAGDTGEVLEAALQRGMDLVLANKKPLAAPRNGNGGLAHAAAARGRRVLHEATVGAGLPIIDTIAKLQESGDEVLRIEGCPSGTLGYLFGELGRGIPFSAALREAMALGYTEPDPREDLSGMDVARKALILGRLLGFDGELDDVHVESLVPPALLDVPTSAFLARLEEMDAPWRERVEAARAAGTVLRYRATASAAAVHVGLVAVGLDSSFATLTGTDNQFAITTARYSPNPIVITGPGAGVAVTAAGVLNDVLKLAGTR